MAEDNGNKSKLTAHEPTKSDDPRLMNKKQKKSKVAVLALLIAVIALYIVVQDKYFTVEDAAIGSINQMITEKVVPEMKRSHERDVVAQIYALKHIAVTLEEIKETSTNHEIKSMVDSMRKQVEELSVKLFVHE